MDFAKFYKIQHFSSYLCSMTYVSRCWRYNKQELPSVLLVQSLKAEKL